MSKVGIQLRGTGAVRSNLRGGGIAKRGTGQALKSGGRTGKFGGGRTNLLEELGRVEAERSNPNRRAEISRVHGELNRGYAAGGAVKIGKRFLDFIKTGKHVDKSGVKVNVAKAAERLTGKPHVDHGKRKKIKHLGRGKAEGGRIGFRTGSRGPSAGERIKARKSREREWWTTRGGPEGSKEDRSGQKFFGPYDKELREKRPHSSPEGRAIDVRKRAENYRKNKNLDQVRRNLQRPGRRAPFSMAGKVIGDVKKAYKRISHEVPTGPHTDVRRRKLNKKWQRKKLGVSPEMKATLKGLRGKSLHNPHTRDVPTMAAEGGRIGFKKGTDKNWIQKVNKSIKKRGTKGKCTPITKPGCTGRAKALAKTFKKMAAKRKS